MIYDDNWDRWIFASIAVEMTTLAVANGITALVEGLDKRTEAFMSADKKVEIRVNGPFSIKLNQEWQLRVDVNLLFSSTLEGNRYALVDIIGKFHQKLAECFPVKKYGLESGDDESVVGILRPVDSVKKFFFGQVDPTVQLVQAGINAQLIMYI